jgi:hypothetical protein
LGTTFACQKKSSTLPFFCFIQINSLDVSEPKEIRLKLVLALNNVNKEFYDPHSCDIPLEMMPNLLEMLQQDITRLQILRSRVTNK